MPTHLPPIRVSPALQQACPVLRIGVLYAQVRNGPTTPELKKYAEDLMEQVAAGLHLEQIASHPVIAATRRAYKACGKDPSRYRPSAEALRRRVVKGAALYYINTTVDIINCLSLKSGFSISAFDAEKICEFILWDIGRPGEIIASLGRGDLNAEGLPVMRDAAGIIGSPTSDCRRTGITETTQAILVNIPDFSSSGPLEELIEEMRCELVHWAEGRCVQEEVIQL